MKINCKEKMNVEKKIVSGWGNVKYLNILSKFIVTHKN